jgi:hypothetical protein
MRETLLTKFGMNRGRLVGHLYLGSKLAGGVTPLAKQLS